MSSVTAHHHFVARQWHVVLAVVALAVFPTIIPAAVSATPSAGPRTDASPPMVHRCEAAGRVTYSATPCADGAGTAVAPLTESPEQRARSREAKAELRAEQRELDRQRAARERAERQAQRDRLAALRATTAPTAGSVVADRSAKKSKKRRATKAARVGATDVDPAPKTAKKRSKKTPPAKRAFDPVHSPPRRKSA